MLYLQVTGPVVRQVIPSLCSISQWNGCCRNTGKYFDCPMSIAILTARMAGSWFRSMGFITMNTCWFLCASPEASFSADLQ